MARPSHGIAKIGSVKVISFLKSQVHAVIEIYADVSVTWEGRWRK